MLNLLLNIQHDSYVEFYGWDVLNEAISDATGTYRTESENGESLSADTHGSNSSWWKVYQSNEYVINAFKFANKYAPDYVELYYNDYNECTPLKSNGIVQLIEDVKAAEGTRLDGFGMQGHYDLTQPTGGQIKVAARRFAEVAGSVSLTELDLKASTTFDGTEEGTQKEYRKQYYLYKEMYKGLAELIDEGIATVIKEGRDIKSVLEDVGISNINSGMRNIQIKKIYLQKRIIKYHDCILLIILNLKRGYFIKNILT